MGSVRREARALKRALKLSYAANTNPGSRDGNEDSYGVSAAQAVWADKRGTGNKKGANSEPGNEPQLFVVADGLGGHGGGEVASALAVEQALALFEKEPGNLSACFKCAQEAILARQASEAALRDMKSTLVALRISKDTAQWAHIGDTRLYWFAKGRLRAQTLDHSVPQMLVATGEIRAEDIRHHEDRNRLVKVLGVEWDTPRFEVADPVALEGTDSFLLATDGFWEYVEERDMERCLRLARSPGHWLSKMLAVAQKNAQGCDRDNYTAIAVFVR